MVDIWWTNKQFYRHLKQHVIFQDFTDFSAKDILSYTQYMKKKSSVDFWIQVDFSLLPSTKVQGQVRISFLRGGGLYVTFGHFCLVT